MTTKQKVILASLGLLSAGAGIVLYRYYNKQVKLLGDYDIRPVGVKVLRWEKDGSLATLEFTVRITNKSNIEAVITQLHSDIYLNNQYLGYVINNGSILVPAKGSADAKVQITFAPKEALKNIISTVTVLLGTKDIPYRLKGYAKVKSSFIAVSVPFDETRSLKGDLLG